ncbi:phenylalanine--tRNA ligase subunit beta [Fulvivirga sp. M361]|uniref:phenylalanine--tRNA ligase subunit beta n=1 Tax=Fulvivirga sp. M361 TaxID=2594266 RepID=UPI00117B6B54|nr:phenylalanine--tRNA ligase subunit beta [Fulvivirga sp. M361]TRX49218.1 phenylalanine--tRNA ligase subunit beta [Fulvivirga sp. M361]
MKISLNWLKTYIDLNDTPEKIGQILTDTGLEVEGIEKIESVKGGLAGIVIGEVLTCEKHPNADKLKITTVDIGEETPSPIVCGAPNVQSGQKVVVATVGATLYPTGHDAFKIKKAKIRGEVSEGMICAEDEIGLGQSHDGIMVLDTDVPNGTPASDYFDLDDDHVFEIGLTPNRADAASHLGTARDLKAALQTEVKWPAVDEFVVENNDRPITIKVENQDACPRYVGLTISNVTVKESPEWLQQRLVAIGLTPINNIVDVTNFVQHEVGQPLHAFDADEIAEDTVIVKTLPEGSKFTTLDEKERLLSAADLMICNGKSEGMCIAGVFGGIGSGVKETTQNIFLESAYFSADSIRKTAQRHQLKTDASFRYERGTDPRVCVYAAKRAALLIKELSGGEVSSEIIDLYPKEVENFRIEVKFKNIYRLLGIELERQRIFEILGSLDIEIEEESKDKFLASVPPYRVDVQREADIAEEILRIYGFNNITIPESFNSDYLAEFPQKDASKTQKGITELLVANGFYEIMTNSLTKPVYAEKAEDLDSAQSVEVLNKLSEDLGVLRQSLLYNGLEVAAYNINRKQTNLKFFEFGKNYFRQDKDYNERVRLGLFMSGYRQAESWTARAEKIKFHDLASAVQLVLKRLADSKLESDVIHQYPYDYALEMSLNKQVLVTYGKIKDTLLKESGIKQELFYADMDWDLLLKLTNNNIVYQEVSKFPEVRRDLSLVLDKSVAFQEIQAIAKRHNQHLVRNINVFDVYEGEKVGKDKKAYAMSFVLQDKEKTLTDKVIDRVMNKMMQAFENELGAIIRK